MNFTESSSFLFLFLWIFVKFFCKNFFSYVSGGDALENIFHMHGYSFYVVAMKIFEKPVSTDLIKDMDAEGILFRRNLVSPVLKDTIRVPKFGAVAIRFFANNPGKLIEFYYLKNFS